MAAAGLCERIEDGGSQHLHARDAVLGNNGTMLVCWCVGVHMVLPMSMTVVLGNSWPIQLKSKQQPVTAERVPDNSCTLLP